MAALVASALLINVPLARAEVGVGDLFPPLTQTGLDGADRPATAGKVTLVDFWASWCAPRKVSFPVYARLDVEFGPTGLVIVAVSADEDPVAYASFVRKFNPPFFILLDRDLRLVRSTQIPTTPTSYLMDHPGKVRYEDPGFHGSAIGRTLRTEIETMLSEESP